MTGTPGASKPEPPDAGAERPEDLVLVRSPVGPEGRARADGWRKAGVAVALGAIYVIWGSTYLAIKLAIATVPPFTTMALRSFLAGAILYAWGRWRGAPPPRAEHWLAGAVVGAFLFLGGHGALGWAQQHVPSGTAALFLATIPLWMTVVEALSRRRAAISVRAWLGIPVGLTGILVLVGPRLPLGGEPAHLLGAFVLVLSALAWSIGSGIARRVPRPSSLSVTTGTYLLTGGALLWVASVASGEAGRIDPGAVSVRSLGAIAYLVTLGSVVAFSAYSWLLRRVPLQVISTYAFVNPVIAVAVGWGIGGEPLTPRVFAATALVVGGVVLLLSGGTPRRAALGRDRKKPQWWSRGSVLATTVAARSTRGSRPRGPLRESGPSRGSSSG